MEGGDPGISLVSFSDLSQRQEVERIQIILIERIIGFSILQLQTCPALFTAG